MKANELRIGNFIYWNIPEKEKTIHTVVGIRNGKPQTVPISLGERIEDYKPIPLTKEWLLKFGFKYVKVANEYKLEFGFIVIIFNHGVIYIGLDSIRKSVPHISCVHQLQNLYWCLTGEELRS